MAEADVRALVALLEHRRLAVLTGAGCSTESGIPDYRGPASRGKLRTPIQGYDFMRHASVRARYWARSMVGWPLISRAEPNAGHYALAQMELRGWCSAPVTQNVDGLHQSAGSGDVIELHGKLRDVRCLECGAREPRRDVQARLVASNPGLAEPAVNHAPDGDADVPAEQLEAFRVPTCLACEGVLKPDVVFFGENVAREVVEQAFARVERAEALLVVGTSLTVYSGLRFVKRAKDRGMPIAIVNMGETRGDDLATLRVDAGAGEVLTALVGSP